MLLKQHQRNNPGGVDECRLNTRDSYHFLNVKEQRKIASQLTLRRRPRIRAPRRRGSRHSRRDKLRPRDEVSVIRGQSILLNSIFKLKNPPKAGFSQKLLAKSLCHTESRIAKKIVFVNQLKFYTAPWVNP